MNISFESQFLDVKEVQSNKNYWFIRTYGGEVFDSYLKEEYVGLGFNEVPMKYIDEAKFGDFTTYNALRNFIETNTENKKAQASKVANQLIDFRHEMKVGDTVIMPSAGSVKLAFGTIASNVYVIDKPQPLLYRGVNQYYPEKRRKVDWEKIIYKDDPHYDFKTIMPSYAGLSNLNSYSEKIECVLSSLFQKNGHTFLVIQIDQDEEINAFEFNRFLSSLTYFYKEFCKEEGVEENEDLTIKIKIQSKGNSVLKGLVQAAIIGLAGIVILSDNSSVKLEVGGVKLEAKSDGGLKSYSNFIERDQERKKQFVIFTDSMAALKAKRNIDSSTLHDSTSHQSEKDGKKDNSQK